MVSQSVAELLKDHVTLTVEGIDRMYLNAYQPLLQTPGGVVHFFKEHQKKPVVSSVLMGPMTEAFVRSIHEYAKAHGVEMVRFEKGERKDDVFLERLKKFEFAGEEREGVVFIGVAQEKFAAFRTRKKRNPETGTTYPWLYRSTVMCNQYYFYLVDRDFGPLFIKFSSYFPYTARVCINGYEYAKRQLEKAGVPHEPLDNGFFSCSDPRRLQRILDALDEQKIRRLFEKWLRRLPHPFSAKDQAAGYRYELSMLQTEFSLTQVFDRPLAGRYFFEEVIRDHLDLGRPEQVSLIFNRRVTKRTPGTFRTRVITQGVIPSLHVRYKNTKVKQYFKEGRALRTETTINNTWDFGIGRRLKNLPELRKIGFAANRRLLDVQRISHGVSLEEGSFDRLIRPTEVAGQRTPAMRFGDPRVMALLTALCHLALLARPFAHRALREAVAPLLAQDLSTYTSGRMTYDLRRLRLHGLIQRIPRTHTYLVTDSGLRTALFLTKLYSRVLRPGSAPQASASRDASPHSPGLQRLHAALDRLISDARIAA